MAFCCLRRNPRVTLGENFANVDRQGRVPLTVRIAHFREGLVAGMIGRGILRDAPALRASARRHRPNPPRASYGHAQHHPLLRPISDRPALLRRSPRAGLPAPRMQRVRANAVSALYELDGRTNGIERERTVNELETKYGRSSRLSPRVGA
jgi:hypothetical protein